MTIIASVDQSDQAPAIVAEAASLGEAFDEPVHAVYVLDRDRFVGLQRTSVRDKGETIPVERITKVATEIAGEAIEEAGVTAEAVGLRGSPSEEIVDYADKHDARYIVVGGRKQSPVGKALFGSVAQSVLLKAHQPVVALARQPL